MLIKQVHQKSITLVTTKCQPKYQPNVYNRCHDLLIMSMNFSDNAILNIKGSNYCCIIRGISQGEAINVMQITDLTGKSGTL